jgi:hypothetical protein
VYHHPDVSNHITRPRLADVAQLYALGSVALSQAANLFVIGPMTSRCVPTPFLWREPAVLKSDGVQDDVPAAQAREERR